jgi:hypothetical protein
LIAVGSHPHWSFPLAAYLFQLCTYMLSSWQFNLVHLPDSAANSRLGTS